MTQSLIPSKGGHVPAQSVGREPAHVLTREQREGRVRRAARRWANCVAYRGPVGPVVRGDLQTVRGGDDRRVASCGDTIGRHILPFRSQLLIGPVAPGLPPVQRKSPTITDGAVPDLTPRAEGKRLDEIHGDRAGGG